MKIFLVSLFAINGVLSLGSGPYLPSGWRPSGPAFFLPSEVRAAPKPAATTPEPVNSEAVNLPLQLNSLEVKIPEYTAAPAETTTAGAPLTESGAATTEAAQEVSVEENEASGSNFLREYGPPAVSDIQLITVQGLPEVAMEHAFRVDKAKESEVVQISEDVQTSIDARNSVSLITAEEDTIVDVTTKSEVAENEIVSGQKESSVELKSSQEDVSVQTEGTVEAKTNAKSAIEAIIEVGISEATTEKFEETFVVVEESGKTFFEEEPQSATEGTVTNDDSSLSVKSIDAVAPVTVDTGLDYLPPANERQEDNVINQETPVSLEVPLTSEKTEDNEVATKNENEQVEVKVEESSGSGQAPDVLDEQERVGFREYGPPKSADEKSEDEKIENNETRKRRFSSRFPSLNKH